MFAEGFYDDESGQSRDKSPRGRPLEKWLHRIKGSDPLLLLGYVEMSAAWSA